MKKLKPEQVRTRSQLYAECYKRYGLPVQLIQLIQEMAELTKEITKRIFSSGMDDLWIPEAMVEEVVDVEIMIEQMRIIYGNRIFDTMKAKKLDRLRKRILQ